MAEENDYCLEEVRRMIVNNLGDQLDDFLARLGLPRSNEDDAMSAIKNIPWTQLKLTMERIGETDLVEEIQRKTLVTEGILKHISSRLLTWLFLKHSTFRKIFNLFLSGLFFLTVAKIAREISYSDSGSRKSPPSGDVL